MNYVHILRLIRYVLRYYTVTIAYPVLAWNLNIMSKLYSMKLHDLKRIITPTRPTIVAAPHYTVPPPQKKMSE